MLSSCKEVANARIIADGKVDMVTDFDTGLCWGAFASIQTIIKFGTPDPKTKIVAMMHNVCAPKDSTRTQLVAIFVEYVKKHPEAYNSEYLPVALTALRAAFPCSSK